jgi:GTPase SAR1 family protein
VSEILNAEKSVVQNKKIDNLKAFVEGQFTDLVHYLGANKEWAGYKSCGENLLRSFWEWAVKKEKVWLDGKTTIAFLGEFSAGKTSIVNRIYSQDNKNVPKLPVSTEATTAIPTYIAGGNCFSYTFVTPSDERKKLKPETFNLVSKRILDNIKGTSSLIKYFVMTCDNPNLANFSILDTPGFSSNDKEDEYRTTDVIRESDALFWVFDVNNGTVNRKSIEILKKESQLPPLYVVINKIDTKADVEVQKVESLIRKTLADEGLNVKGYIRFSSQAPLENIMRVVKSISPQQNESYLLDMDNYLKGILNDVETIKRDMENRSKDARDVVARNNTSFDEKLQKTASDIESLENYLKHEEEDTILGIFTISEEHYKVSKHGFNAFKSKLREISNFVEETLRNNIKTYGNNVAASEDRMKNLQGIKDVYNRVRDCVDSFNRVKNI